MATSVLTARPISVTRESQREREKSSRTTTVKDKLAKSHVRGCTRVRKWVTETKKVSKVVKKEIQDR